MKVRVHVEEWCKGKSFKQKSNAFIAYGRYNVRLYIWGGRMG